MEQRSVFLVVAADHEDETSPLSVWDSYDGAAAECDRLQEHAGETGITFYFYEFIINESYDP